MMDKSCITCSNAGPRIYHGNASSRDSLCGWLSEVDGECANWRAKPRHGLRPVQTYGQAEDGKVEARIGWFHEFVLMPDYSCYNDLDACTYTFSKHCAVVEYEDGTVGYIPSDYIKFIDIGGTENDC